VKSYKQFCEDCGCEKKSKKGKKKSPVEVMPIVKDGSGKLMGVKETFAGDYSGPLYAPHPELQEKAPPGAKYERMVKHIKRGYSDDGKLSDKEKSIAYATAWKMKNKNK